MQPVMLVAELISVLTQHAGREYQATLRPHTLRPQTVQGPHAGGGRRRKAAAPPASADPDSSVGAGATYLFVRRGEHIQATGPSGQTRLLDLERFSALFAQAQFEAVTPTGRLSDLGPLFGAAQDTVQDTVAQDTALSAPIATPGQVG